MTSRYRHRRTPLAATPFPSPVEPGEIVVNTAQRQIAVGDAAAGTLGQPKQLIGVRFFDATGAYVLNDIVVQNGKIYKANGSIPPGTFNASNWSEIGSSSTAAMVGFAPGGNVSATNVQAAIAEVDAEKAAITYVDAADAALASANALKADKTYVDSADALKADKTYVDSADALKADKTYVDTQDALKVAKAGDTMTGPLILNADPSNVLGAATKQYVDAAGASLFVAASPPVGAKDGSLWWESDTGLLYVRYNDGNSTQWVIACPQPDTSVFVTRSHLAGLALSTAGSSTTFSVAAGQATDDGNTATIALAAAISKTSGAWVAGSGNGALDTGTVVTATWYHVFLIKRTDTGVVDVLVSLSPTAPTMPASYTLKRRIGAMRIAAGGQWTKFSQVGDNFLWTAGAFFDANNVALNSSSRNFVTLTVPSGVNVEACFNFLVAGPSATVSALVTSPLQLDEAAAANGGGGVTASAPAASPYTGPATCRVLTNTSQQVGVRGSTTGNFYISTTGWIDRRGKDD